MPHGNRKPEQEYIEEEVRKEMRTSPIDIDGIYDVQPRLGQEDVKDLSSRDQRLVWEMAKLTQQVQILIGIVVKTNNEHLMRIEANQIRIQIATGNALAAAAEETKNIHERTEKALTDAANETKALQFQAKIVKGTVAAVWLAAIGQFVSWFFHRFMK